MGNYQHLFGGVLYDIITPFNGMVEFIKNRSPELDFKGFTITIVFIISLGVIGSIFNMMRKIIC